jgi:hypothetical protein
MDRVEEILGIGQAIGAVMDGTDPETHGSLAVYRIFIERIGTSVKGDVYDVTRDGRVIVKRSRSPFLDAARVCRADGLSGRLEARRHGASAPFMCADIEAAAGIAIREDAKCGPLFVRWKPFDPTKRIGIAIARALSEARKPI